MMKVKRNYGNGFEVEVEGKDMVEVIKNLSQADEVFYDIRAFGRDDSGKVVVSDKVKFTIRHTTARKTGAPCEYIEQYCTEGPLKGYKREVGKFNAPRLGEVFVRKAPPPPEEQKDLVLGFAGWTKYVGQPGGQYGQQGAQNGSQQGPHNSSQQDSQQGYQQGYQQKQNNPHTAPVNYSNPHSVPVSEDDIPF